jgi:hypothetical protein
MHRRLRHTTAAIGAAAVLAVAGCGTADQASTTAAGGTAAAAQAGGPGGALSAASLKTLAAKLGVSTSRLKAAMEKSRPDVTSGKPQSGDPTAALAKALDLSTVKVQAAMKAAGMGRGGAPPSGAAPSQSATQS